MDNKNYTQALQAISRQINYVKHNGFPGLCSDFAEILNNDSSLTWSNDAEAKNINEDGNVSEELTVRLPFAGTNFCVRLLFHLNEPWMAPDLIFSDQKFMSKVLLKELEDQVSSLDSWNYTADDIIAQLLLHLHRLYKNYQLERLVEEEEVLQLQYQSLLKSLDICQEDVEISVGSSCGSWSPPSILIRLPLSFLDVPPVLIDTNPGPAITLLHINLQRSNGGFTPRLHLSPRVESLIGGSSTLALPHVPQGASVRDYVIKVLDLLEKKVHSAVLSFETRKQFIAQVLCQFGRAVLEYDAEKFSKVVLMLDWKDFNFLIFITLSHLFPQEAPTIVLRSLYHSSHRMPFSRELNDYSFNSTWNPEEMVRQVREAVLQFIPAFQLNSIKTTQ